MNKNQKYRIKSNKDFDLGKNIIISNSKMNNKKGQYTTTRDISKKQIKKLSVDSL